MIDTLTIHEVHEVKSQETECLECWKNERIHPMAETMLRKFYSNKEDGIGKYVLIIF